MARARGRAEELPLFADLPEEEAAPPPLDGLSLEQEVTADYECTGLSLKAHPDALRAFRPGPVGRGDRGGAGRRPGPGSGASGRPGARPARPSTAGGTVFLTLEDETGTANLVVWPRIWEQYRRAIRQAVALIAHGRLERSGGVIHLCASRLEDVSERLAGWRHGRGIFIEPSRRIAVARRFLSMRRPHGHNIPRDNTTCSSTSNLLK